MKITKNRLKQIIKEELDKITYDDALGTTEPRYDTGMRSPEEKLIHALAARAGLEAMSPEEREQLAGGDAEVMQLIQDLMSDKMLDPRM